MMADIGVVVPPAGVVPDFKGQSSLQRSLIILVSITFALATLFLLIRLYTSAVILKELVLDDGMPYCLGLPLSWFAVTNHLVVLIVLAWGCSLAFTVGQLVSKFSGFSCLYICISLGIYLHQQQ